MTLLIQYKISDLMSKAGLIEYRYLEDTIPAVRRRRMAGRYHKSALIRKASFEITMRLIIPSFCCYCESAIDSDFDTDYDPRYRLLKHTVISFLGS